MKGQWGKCPLGLYRTSRLVQKSDKFSKSGLSGNQTFSFPDARLLKIEKNPIDPTKISDVLVALFWYIACRRWKILLSFTKKLITGRLSLSLEMKPFKLPGQIDVQYCAQCCVELFSISLKVYFHCLT